MNYHISLTISHPDYKRPYIYSVYKSVETKEEVFRETKLYIIAWYKDYLLNHIAEEEDFVDEAKFFKKEHFINLLSFYDYYSESYMYNKPIDGVYFGPDGHHFLKDFIEEYLSSLISRKENLISSVNGQSPSDQSGELSEEDLE